MTYLRVANYESRKFRRLAARGRDYGSIANAAARANRRFDVAEIDALAVGAGLR